MSGEEGLPIPVTMPGGDPALALLTRIAEALEKTGQKAAEAGQKVEASSGRLQQSIATIGNSSNTWADVGKGLTGVAAGFNAVAAAGATVLQVVDHVASLVAEQENLDRQSARLGLNFDDAAAAAGRFTDEADAMRVAGAFAAQGIRLTQVELEAATHAAARMAQETGTEVPAALEQLTQGLLRGKERSLAPFGAELSATARHGYTLREGLGALVEQESHFEAATNDAHTSAQGLADSFGDLARNTATWASGILGLPGLVASVTSAVGDLAGQIAEVNRLEAEQAARQAEGGAQSRAREAFAAAQRRSGELADALGADRRAIRVENINSLTTEQITALTARINAVNARLGATQRAGVDDIAERSRDALRPAAGSVVRLDTRRDVGTDPFLASVTHTEQEIQRASRSTVISVERDRAELVAAYRDAGRELDQAQAAAAAAARARAAEEERNRRQTRGGAGGANAAAAAALREARAEMASDAADKRAQNERDLREEETYLSERRRLAEATAAVIAADLANAQAEGRLRAANDQGKGAEQSRLNRQDEERQNSTRIRSFFDEESRRAVDTAKVVQDAYGQMTEAASGHFAALVLGQETAGQALGGFVHDTLEAFAKISAQQAVFELAKGFAALFLNPAEAGAHFAAAALFGTAAVGAGLGAQATAPPETEKHTTASQGGSQRAAPVSARDASKGDGAVVINVAFGGPVIGAGGARQVGRYLAEQLNAAHRQGGVTLAPGLLRAS